MFSFAITKRQRQLRDAGFDLYNRAVDQARGEYFYQSCHVADTIDGRFDLIVLQLFLLIHSMQRFDDQDSVDLQQKLFDVLFWDMDRNLREMGVGDLGVPRRIRTMMLAFNGRCLAYGEALQTNDMQALAQALQKNIYRGDVTGNAKSVQLLIGYMQAQLAHLQAFSLSDFLAGQAQFQVLPTA